ncbi:MAG: hypothetical protein OEV25_10315 [Deltaproteobacteria bacterium]|nr:hypothetical protein [Deltaproteobacteria bacterium]
MGHLATAGCWFPYLNGTSQEPTPEDARKDGHIRGRSKLFMKYSAWGRAIFDANIADFS